MAAPTSQKADVRPIGFVLDNQITGQITRQDLVIRPEELVRPQPSRNAVAQTLGSAFVDGWGEGLANVNISGHTGWRGGLAADGVASFQALKRDIWDAWHNRRADAVQAAQDPNKVKLYFADALDRNVDLVVPVSFSLKRSRSRPLFMVYQIAMIVIAENIDPTTLSLPLGQTSLRAATYDSLNDGINTLNGFAPQLPTIFDATTAPVIGSLISLSTNAFSSVLSAIKSGLTPDPALIGVSTDLARVGSLAMNMYLAVGGTVNAAMVAIGQIAGAFGNVLCLLLNALRPLPQFVDYADLYGSSFCSSTSGGSPISPLGNQNPFALIAPPATPGVSVSALARTNIGLLGTSDPVLSPLTLPQLRTQVSSITAGIALQ
jgi:hypothetical protein